MSDAASGAGFLAATIAVCGFLMQAPPALARKDEKDVKVATVVGGLFGFFFALVILLIAS